MADALVAGIARANALAVATRNVADFERLEVDVFNPWEAP
jgi:predicted nucleic acid-binding protein